MKRWRLDSGANGDEINFKWGRFMMILRRDDERIFGTTPNFYFLTLGFKAFVVFAYAVLILFPALWVRGVRSFHGWIEGTGKDNRSMAHL